MIASASSGAFVALQNISSAPEWWALPAGLILGGIAVWFIHTRL